MKKKTASPAASQPAPSRSRGAPAARPAVLAGAAVTLALAGAALFNRSRAKKAEAGTPPIGRFVEVDGVSLHYIDRGHGRPIVLLHGNGAMIQDWEVSGVLAGAEGSGRVIAFDRPGFGYSERPRTTVWTPAAQADLIFRALKEIGVEQPVVVGHSWGTLVALAMALNHPGEVAGLVLLSGYYFPTARPDVLPVSAPALPIAGDVLRYTISPLAGRLLAPAMFKTIFAPAPVPDRFAEWPVELSMRPSQIRATAADTALMVPGAASMRHRYHELDLPVAVLGATGDKIVHFDGQAPKLQSTVAGSELVTIPDAGHMIHYADPQAVIRAIDRVVERADARRTGAPSPTL